MTEAGRGRSGIELVLNSKVQSVRKNCVSVAGPGGHVVDIPFGACVWATGVAMSPLVKQLQVRLRQRRSLCAHESPALHALFSACAAANLAHAVARPKKARAGTLRSDLTAKTSMLRL